MSRRKVTAGKKAGEGTSLVSYAEKRTAPDAPPVEVSGGKSDLEIKIVMRNVQGYSRTVAFLE